MTGLSAETLQANMGSKFSDEYHFGTAMSIFFPCFTGILSGRARVGLFADLLTGVDGFLFVRRRSNVHQRVALGEVPVEALLEAPRCAPGGGDEQKRERVQPSAARGGPSRGAGVAELVGGFLGRGDALRRPAHLRGSGARRARCSPAWCRS